MEIKAVNRYNGEIIKAMRRPRQKVKLQKKYVPSDIKNVA